MSEGKPTREAFANELLRSLEGPVIAHYRPQFIDQGGEHLVFSIPEHPELVVKVETESLKRLLEESDSGTSIEDAISKYKPLSEDYIKREQQRYEEVRSAFGAAHVPSQKKYITSLPISRDIAETIVGKKLSRALPKEVPMIVTVQKKIEAFDVEHFSVVAGYTEETEILPEEYNDVTEHLVFGARAGDLLPEEQFLRVQSHEDLKELVENAASDPDLKAALRDFAERAIRYTEQSGNILDFCGRDNIVFFQKDGAWTYSLPDTRYPDDGEEKLLEVTKGALLELSNGHDISSHERNVLLNMFNYVRTLNGIAEQAGSRNYLNILPENRGEVKTDFLKLLKMEFSDRQ